MLDIVHDTVAQREAFRDDVLTGLANVIYIVLRTRSERWLK